MISCHAIYRSGPKRIVLACGFISIFASALLAVSGSIEQLLVARFMVGVSSYVSLTASCFYIDGILERDYRSFFHKFSALAVNFGFFLSQLYGYELLRIDNWRLLFASGIGTLIHGTDKDLTTY